MNNTEKLLRALINELGYDIEITNEREIAHYMVECANAAIQGTPNTVLATLRVEPQPEYKLIKRDSGPKVQ